MINQHMFEMWC